MNTLRAKITALLVGAVLLVVMLATGISFFLLAPPHFELADRAFAAQWSQSADLVAHSSASPADLEKLGVRSEMPKGEVVDMITNGVGVALARLGRTESVVVLSLPDSPSLVMTGQLHDGRWLVLPISVPQRPGDGVWALVGWALIIALGTTLVIIVAVRRLTEPLVLLERTVATLGPTGELQPLPEKGPTEVRAAAQAINRLSTRLKRAMESRIRVVAAAGHDLRTPITRMRLRAEFLEDAERASWIADLDELDRIADSAIRLVREEVDGSPPIVLRFDRLVGEVVDELRAIGLDVTLLGAAPVSICARPLALRRAIRNLVINAATHGLGAQIHVGEEDGAAVLVIADEGPGIPHALIDRVFEPFFRVDPARGNALPGAGLGLAIAHEIILANDGTLELRNRSQGGLLQSVRFSAVAGP